MMDSEESKGTGVSDDDVNHLFSKLSDICKQLKQKGEEVLVLTSPSNESNRFGKEFVPMLTEFQKFCKDQASTSSQVPLSSIVEHVTASEDTVPEIEKQTTSLIDDTVDEVKDSGTDNATENTENEFYACDNMDQDVYGSVDVKVEASEAAVFDVNKVSKDSKIHAKVTCVPTDLEETVLTEIKEPKTNENTALQRRSSRIKDRLNVKGTTSNALYKRQNQKIVKSDEMNSSSPCPKRKKDFKNVAKHDTIKRKVHVKVEKNKIEENLSKQTNKDDDGTRNLPSKGLTDITATTDIICKSCGMRFLHDQHLSIHLRKIPNCDTEENIRDTTGGINEDKLNISIKDERNDVKKVSFKKILDSQTKFPYQCPVCHKLFATRKSNLKRHLFNHSDYVVPRCYICGLQVKSHERYLKHISEHNEKPFQCEKCDKQRFETQEELDQHLEGCKTTPTQKDFTCELCGVVSRCRAAYKIHQNVHLGVKLFSCKICGKKMSSQPSVDRHVMVMHQTETPYKCAVCQKAFKVKDNYRKHIRRHEEPKYKCEVCGKTCVEASNLKKHMMTHTKERPFVCEICGKTYGRRSLLDNHRRLHTGEKPFKCSEKGCEKTFRSYANLKQHKRYHSDTFPFVCEICGKAFKQPGRLNHHRKSHSEEYQWPCAYCPEKFRSLFVYKGHLVREHAHMKHDIEKKTNIRLHQCHLCPKIYAEKEDLTRHIYIHKGIKPFECKFCSKAFNDKSNLKQHTKIHLNVRKFACGICDKTFVLKKVLRSHMRNTHGQKYSYMTDEKAEATAATDVEKDVPIMLETHVILENKVDSCGIITIPQHALLNETFTFTSHHKHDVDVSRESFEANLPNFQVLRQQTTTSGVETVVSYVQPNIILKPEDLQNSADIMNTVTDSV